MVPMYNTRCARKWIHGSVQLYLILLYTAQTSKVPEVVNEVSSAIYIGAIIRAPDIFIEI